MATKRLIVLTLFAVFCIASVDRAAGDTFGSGANGLRPLPSLRIGDFPTGAGWDIGFRVASIAEPSTLLLGTMASIGLLWRRRELLCASVLAAFVCAATSAHAVTIDMVPVDNPGNAPDTRYVATGVGSVDHIYQIGKFEVTAGQYTEFLNAVAKADPNELYNAAMGVGTFGAHIQQIGSSPNYSYSVAADWANRPVNYVSFWDAARFCNWLHNGQPSGPQGPGTTEDGAYHNVGSQELFGRNAGAKFFVPTEDEWYKAAYHDKTAGLAASYFDYPTGTNVVPGNDTNEATDPHNNANYYTINYAIGSPYYRTVAGEFELSDSPYGTFDQGGNVEEWSETVLFSSDRVLRGGPYVYSSYYLYASTRDTNVPTNENNVVGFRVASIPEPSTILLLACGAGAAIVTRVRFRSTRRLPSLCR